MKRSRIDILFVGHDASQTGAPNSLLRILRWLNANTDLKFAVLLRSGGPLEDEYHKIAKTRLVDITRFPTSSLARWILRIAGVGRLINFINRTGLRILVQRWNPSLIYANTSATGDILEFLRFLHLPVITHVRELEVIIRTLVGIEPFAQTVRYTNQYLAVSQAVKNNLISGHGIDEERITIAPGFLPRNELADVDRHTAKRALLQRFGLPDNAFVIGASGTPGWRKGSDLFVQLAGCVKRKCPDAPICFVWIGGPLSDSNSEFLTYDSVQLDVADRISFIETQSDPAPLFHGLDAFAMVSREDPYPLVTFEVAVAAVPVLCFDKAGGAQELIGDDAGFVVPYLDIDVMADRVIELFESPSLCTTLGDRIRRRAAERNNADAVMPVIADLIQRMIDHSGDSAVHTNAKTSDY